MCLGQCPPIRPPDLELEPVDHRRVARLVEGEPGVAMASWEAQLLVHCPYWMWPSYLDAARCFWIKLNTERFANGTLLFTIST